LRLTIRVPATCANLGPGFDVLGLALDLHNEFIVNQADGTYIKIEGLGHSMPHDESNLFYRAFSHLYQFRGEQAPPLHVQMRIAIPPGRGLGSSATAVVGGLVAANAFLGTPLTNDELLPHAVQLEPGRHPDNVAPALLGGLVVNVLAGDRVTSLRVPFPDDLKAVLFIPHFTMDTVQGRALMPAQYPTADVVFNSSRVALFLAALSKRRYDLLRLAMEDRMHQPYRARIFPAMPTLIQAALDAGAHGACLSGGGSSILALATGDLVKIGEAMRHAAKASGIDGIARVHSVSSQGASLEVE
jgi:homoserine kinase